MALCASGEMSLAGSTVGRSVACELGCSGTGEISMDRADVRDLAGRPGAGCAICMCDFYGKSAGPPPPPALGCAYEGGYYMGAVASPANYYIIVAPNATGCARCRWKTTINAAPNTGSCTDGYANTRNGMTSAIYPAGNWTATRSIGGFSDWYMPARNELNLLYVNRNSLPAGQGYSPNNYYWSSTCNGYGTACAQSFTLAGNQGYAGGFFINNNVYVRAIRRMAF